MRREPGCWKPSSAIEGMSIRVLLLIEQSFSCVRELLCSMGSPVFVVNEYKVRGAQDLRIVFARVDVHIHSLTIPDINVHRGAIFPTFRDGIGSFLVSGWLVDGWLPAFTPENGGKQQDCEACLEESVH